MSRRNKDKGRLAPFVPVTKDTMKTPAWKALSHGARSLYIALKGRYNSRLQNAVYISSRVAVEELACTVTGIACCAGFVSFNTTVSLSWLVCRTTALTATVRRRTIG
jgi:hypothetical protein